MNTTSATVRQIASSHVCLSHQYGCRTYMTVVTFVFAGIVHRARRFFRADCASTGRIELYTEASSAAGRKSRREADAPYSADLTRAQDGAVVQQEHPAAAAHVSDVVDAMVLAVVVHGVADQGACGACGELRVHGSLRATADRTGGQSQGAGGAEQLQRHARAGRDDEGDDEQAGQRPWPLTRHGATLERHRMCRRPLRLRDHRTRCAPRFDDRAHRHPRQTATTERRAVLAARGERMRRKADNAAVDDHGADVHVEFVATYSTCVKSHRACGSSRLPRGATGRTCARSGASNGGSTRWQRASVALPIWRCRFVRSG